MERRYVTCDVFTDKPFGGNPLAVVLDAEALSDAQMLSIAREFGYSETTFVLPPADAQNTARVRIFTPGGEVPFAGHPNVGTGVVLGLEREARGELCPERFVFEEKAGLVQVRLLRDAALLVGAELTAPEPLSMRTSISLEDAAACLSLTANEVTSTNHPPQVVSVGLPFLIVEVATREALRRARPDLAAHERVLKALDVDAVFAYARGESPVGLHARMFAPLDGITEDPATGSATAATVALLASLLPQADGEVHWRVEQGVDMGRASLLLGRTEKKEGKVVAVHVSGHVQLMMRGTLLDPA